MSKLLPKKSHTYLYIIILFILIFILSLIYFSRSSKTAQNTASQKKENSTPQTSKTPSSAVSSPKPKETGKTTAGFPTKVPTGPNRPTDIPTIIPPQGRQGYSVSSGKSTGPKFSYLFIDPNDPPNGQPQKIGVTLTDQDSNIKTVEALIKTDNRERTISLKLAEGDAKNGKWEGSWVMNDTYKYKYSFKLSATDEKNDTTSFDIVY